MSQQMVKKVASLVMQYGHEAVIKSAERIAAAGPTKAELILLNKSRSLPLDERNEFALWLADTLPRYLSQDEAYEVCRRWDEHTGEAWRARPMRNVE